MYHNIIFNTQFIERKNVQLPLQHSIMSVVHYSVPTERLCLSGYDTVNCKYDTVSTNLTSDRVVQNQWASQLLGIEIKLLYYKSLSTVLLPRNTYSTFKDGMTDKMIAKNSGRNTILYRQTFTKNLTNLSTTIRRTEILWMDAPFFLLLSVLGVNFFTGQFGKEKDQPFRTIDRPKSTHSYDRNRTTSTVRKKKRVGPSSVSSSKHK
jgi:hypothetical protein